MNLSPIERLVRRLATMDREKCWEFTGAKTSNGYGRLGISGNVHLAHRVMWEFSRGPIPDGLTIDHLCRNKACCNPEHLEPVTLHENILRGSNRAAVNARKTHCNYGHAFAGENLVVLPSGKRSCRACNRRRGNLYYQLNRDHVNRGARRRYAKREGLS